jgi:hypothetical protein
MLSDIFTYLIENRKIAIIISNNTLNIAINARIFIIIPPNPAEPEPKGFAQKLAILFLVNEPALFSI